MVREAVRIKQVADGNVSVEIEIGGNDVEADDNRQGHEEEMKINVPVSLMNSKLDWFASKMTALGITEL